MATVNKDLLSSFTFRPGEMYVGSMMNISNQTSDQLTEIIEQALISTNKAGSPEQKIADFYRSAADTEGRNAAGNGSIQAYLDAADAIESLGDLIDLRSVLLEETGSNIIMQFAPGIDAKDSTKYTMYFLPNLSPSLPKDYYGEGYEMVSALYINYLTSLCSISGLDDDTAAAYAGYIYELEASMAASMLETQQRGDIDMVYNPYTMSQLQELIPGVDLTALLTRDGYKPESQYIVRDPGLLGAFAAALGHADADKLRAYARFSIISQFASCLSEDYTAAGNEFNRMLLGTEGERSSDEIASRYTQSILSDYLGEVYIEEYFSAEAKADVESMVYEFIEVFAGHIEALGWMSDATKQMALKKLDTMDVKIGYPDSWENIYDNVDITAPSDGGSFYGNMINISLAAQEELVSLQGTDVEDSDWLLSAYTVNAYYNSMANEIVFPAGILQAPFYDVNATREENLGGIGFVIAHEITHCFDNNGAKFDENGNAANWWAEEDYAKFNELCLEVVDYYDGIEYAPGIENSGILTLSENIADLGAMACVIQCADAMDGADYEALFLNLAKCWASTCNREYMEILSQMDVHSGDAIRAARAMQSSDKFYEIFDIKPGDGMYIAPEDRVAIW